MNNPRVSVLMAIHNNVSSVDASIRSIVDQTFTDWEMILWDDASTDGSLHKMLQWQELDNRIKVYSNTTNLGLAASLNKALKKATGVYIARMDGDDVAVSDRLIKQVMFLDANEQYAIVSTGCILFDESGEWGVRSGSERPQKSDFLWGSQFLHPAVMIRKQALDAVDGYRACSETLRTEDYDLFMRMYAAGYEGYNLQESLLYYFENRKPRRVKLLFRWREMKTRYRGFKELELMPKGLLYVLKPLLVGLIPGKLKRNLQQRRQKR